VGVAHWDDVEGERERQGHLSARWTDLGDAAGSRDVGVTRIQVDPGAWSTPTHVELDEEEIFYVLGGAGESWQDGKTYEIADGDCIVHRVGREAHTLHAGGEGLDVLAFGERTSPTMTFLPRAKVVRTGVTLDVSQGPHPWEREAAAGPPELPASSPRAENIVHHASVPAQYDGEEGRWVRLGAHAGSERTGLNWGHLAPGRAGAEPHCHSEDEEIFVVLAGSGTLELLPSPVKAAHAEEEILPVRAGHVIARPPSTGISHFFRAGDEGMTFLAYGTRRPNDVCYYPRSNKIYWRGLGVIARVEQLSRDDGEPEE
jgi:uncharacterized cupin superfamily protein